MGSNWREALAVAPVVLNDWHADVYGRAKDHHQPEPFGDRRLCCHEAAPMQSFTIRSG
jgi:hypothetical protein